MKKSILLGGAFGLLTTIALAQVNTVPAVGTISGIIKHTTYSAASVGLVPAASATDIFCIGNSASRNVHITRIGISGTAGTLVTAPFTLLRRATLDTGGTAATGALLPVAAPNVSTAVAATAVLTAYTANPTINDSAPTYFRSAALTLPVTSAGTSINPIKWNFSTSNDMFSQGLDLQKGVTGQYCINLNAVSVTSGLLQIDIEWTEN